LEKVREQQPPVKSGNLANPPSFPFGWLFLPVDLIGRPFSQKTRDHFLPLLTSTQWWSQTQLALRRVFQSDSDFQERMFARHIAVMNGQAWNVVETLKTPDHGPLELTRRAKVCVWDDLVDVPVALPMRIASAEMRRRATAESDSAAQAAAATANTKASSDIIAEEEMDIGASGGQASSAPTASSGAIVDLLGIASPPADLPHPGRFELAMHDDMPSPSSSNNGDIAHNNRPSRPKIPRAAPSHRSLNVYSPERGPAAAGTATRPEMNSTSDHHHQQTRFSFATTSAARRESNSLAAQLYNHGGSASNNGRAASLDYTGYDHYHHHDYDEHDHDHGEDGDLEGGDLGYAAATGMEGNQRKVIVERLEMVKGRNPVFTWC
jgi:hypothetical protein